MEKQQTELSTLIPDLRNIALDELPLLLEQVQSAALAAALSQASSDDEGTARFQAAFADANSDVKIAKFQASFAEADA